MTFPHFQFTRRTTAMVAVAAVAVLGFGGWALAEGGVPLISASSPDTTTTTAGGGTATAAPGASADNAAVASNTGDGKTVIAISLKIVQTDSSNVDPTNAAVAVASCTDCQTVAIALEGVLVAGSPATFDPTNVALAINVNCNNCQTLASAYQDVVQNDTRVRISGAGRQEIAQVRKDLESLRTSGLDIVAIQQRVNADAGRFLAVLQNDVIPIGRPRPADQASTSTTSTTGPSPSSTTSTTTQGSTSTSAPTTSSTQPTTTTSTTAAPVS